jgi:hypothetical protein
MQGCAQFFADFVISRANKSYPLIVINLSLRASMQELMMNEDSYSLFSAILITSLLKLLNGESAMIALM